MTTTYDPRHPAYLDEADVRGEMTRVYDLCHGCRSCIDLCPAFPTLFELIDRLDDRDAGGLTPSEQDEVVEACYQCKLCAVRCPYTPELHEWALDFPRLMLRGRAMRHHSGHTTVREKLTNQVLGRADLLGAIGTRTAPVANKVLGSEGSLMRRLTAKLTGVSAVRLLPPYTRQRFSTWFRTRAPGPARSGPPQRTVTVFPTCVVEYQQPEIGHDLVKVYERNDIACRTTSAGCCGAPWLHSGDITRFTKIARTNVAMLAADVRAGTDVVVPQPTCSYVIKHDYVDHVGGPDAELVAEHTYDAAEYLMRVHDQGGVEGGLDTDFTGDVPEAITYHMPCHLRAQDIGPTSRDLMALTGAEVTLVQRCSGVDGTWGLRTENESLSIPIAAVLGARIDAAGGDVVAGDCHLANNAITEQTTHRPVHPLQILARAYGIVAENPGSEHGV